MRRAWIWLAGVAIVALTLAGVGSRVVESRRYAGELETARDEVDEMRWARYRWL